MNVTPVVPNKGNAASLVWDATTTHDFVFPAVINVSAVTASSTADDSLVVTLFVVGLGEVRIHSGEGFSRDFTVPVPATKTRIQCRNSTVDCSVDLTVFGT